VIVGAGYFGDMHNNFGRQLKKGPQMKSIPKGRKSSAPDKTGKQQEEEESQRQKEGQHDEEKVGLWTNRTWEVVMWTNLIHLGLGFWVIDVMGLTHFCIINICCMRRYRRSYWVCYVFVEF
jgi:hypothetical protein